jgi:hypothetical protein
MSLENIVQQIDAEIANLTNARNVLAGLNRTSNATSNGSSKGRFTSAARERMAAAQRARWDKYRASKGQSAAKTQPAAKPVRVMSASARKRIASAQKKRWAKIRAAKKAA